MDFRESLIKTYRKFKTKNYSANAFEFCSALSDYAGGDFSTRKKVIRLHKILNVIPLPKLFRENGSKNATEIAENRYQRIENLIPFQAYQNLVTFFAEAEDDTFIQPTPTQNRQELPKSTKPLTPPTPPTPPTYRKPFTPAPPTVTKSQPKPLSQVKPKPPTLPKPQKSETSKFSGLSELHELPELPELPKLPEYPNLPEYPKLPKPPITPDSLRKYKAEVRKWEKETRILRQNYLRSLRKYYHI